MEAHRRLKANHDETTTGRPIMTKQMTMSIFTAGTLVLAITSGALAFGHGMGGSGGCGGGAFLGGGRVLHALDLSADQKQQVQDIVAAHRTTLTPLVANERAAKQALGDKLLGTGTVSSQDVDGLVAQESQARLALMRERLATALEVRNVLTPAQIQKAATIRSGMKELHAQMLQLLGKPGATE
jgi:Spy/CpxP family protein refolding chaperone